MSKAFTKETDNDNEPEQPDIPTGPLKNYVTPLGLELLQSEFKKLRYDERPKIVEVVRWAAGNGDRSENGDYIYGKKRLREIDRRIRYLTKRIDSAIVVDPKLQANLTKVFFGATVTFKKENGSESTLKIVGIDEANTEQNKVSWTSPIAKSLLKSQPGDVITLRTPDGTEKLEVLAVKY